MHTEKITTPKTLRFKLQQENGVGESFRVLYYGKASSVPFMWESQPGTPKHALTESSFLPLTPPPSYQQISQKYNSSREITNHHSSKKSGSLRDFFLASSRKTSSFSSCSISSSSSLTSNMNSSQSSPVMFRIEDDCGGGGDSPTSTLCFGRGFKNSFRIKKTKKTTLSFLRHGKA